ncbi:hypothetical protein Ddc_18830 [Ditylenchus destructor]|nr:hypothetical protein Ddc_18830 [Ditylenchus destructor]
MTGTSPSDSLIGAISIPKARLGARSTINGACLTTPPRRRPSSTSAYCRRWSLVPLWSSPRRCRRWTSPKSAPSSAPTTWRNHVDLSAEPRYVSRGGDAPPRRIRLFIALDDDIRIERMGQLALRKYAGDLVWVRLSRDGQWSLRAGSGLLVDAASDASFQLIVGGQGQIDEATGSRLMSGYRPQALADAIGALLKSLRSGPPARVESTRLLADSLKPPANGALAETSRSPPTASDGRGPA